MTGRSAPDPDDGPFATREQADTVFAAFRDAALAGRSGPPGEQLVFTMTQHLAEALADTIESLGGALGGYDRMLITRLAGYLDPVDTGVVCSWLRRVANDSPDRPLYLIHPDLQQPEAGQ